MIDTFEKHLKFQKTLAQFDEIKNEEQLVQLCKKILFTHQEENPKYVLQQNTILKEDYYPMDRIVEEAKIQSEKAILNKLKEEGKLVYSLKKDVVNFSTILTTTLRI